MTGSGQGLIGERGGHGIPPSGRPTVGGQRGSAGSRAGSRRITVECDRIVQNAKKASEPRDRFRRRASTGAGPRRAAGVERATRVGAERRRRLGRPEQEALARSRSPSPAAAGAARGSRCPRPTVARPQRAGQAHDGVDDRGAVRAGSRRRRRTSGRSSAPRPGGVRGTPATSSRSRSRRPRGAGRAPRSAPSALERRLGVAHQRALGDLEPDDAGLARRSRAARARRRSGAPARRADAARGSRSS